MDNMPEHPGIIVFVDGKTQEVTDEMLASEVPINIRFVKTESGFVPVVKIISFMTEDKNIIRQYGPNDELLQSTIQVTD